MIEPYPKEPDNPESRNDRYTRQLAEEIRRHSTAFIIDGTHTSQNIPNWDLSHSYLVREKTPLIMLDLVLESRACKGS